MPMFYKDCDEMSSAFYKLISALKAMDGKKDYNSQDVKFVRGMIPHHEMAVEMADKQIDKGENGEIIDMARDIKKAQTAEIKALRAWLKERDLKEAGDGGGM